MHNYNRDIILLLKEQRIYRHDIEVKKLHALIASVEKIEVFCTVHELVVRNRITQKIQNCRSDENPCFKTILFPH